MKEDRRKFVKNICATCLTIAGIGALSTVLDSCSSILAIQVVPSNGIITVPTSKFTEDNKVVVLKNFDKLNFDVAVVKFDEKTYRAFELQCTHVPGNPLVATETGFYCNNHGSAFNLDGKVKRSPASRELREYPLKIYSGIIQIKVS